MLTRRAFCRSTVMISSLFTLAGISPLTSGRSTPSLWMPEESEPHARTWMAFVANDTIWAQEQIPQVKRDLAAIAKIIAKYEPVSMLVSADDYDEAFSLLNGLHQHNYPIDLIEFESDDLWLRDSGPTFVTDSDAKQYAIDFNFNGWGGKQEHRRDAEIAGFIADYSAAHPIISNLTIEGGCFETDGHGTAILTKSCIINDNRNPNISQQTIGTELKLLLGLKKIIWLDGIKGKDITDGHTDFYARFAKPGTVLVGRENDPSSYDYEITRQNIEYLKQATDARGHALNVVVLDAPDYVNESFGIDYFAAGYIGYYLCNNAVILQKFGDDAADNKAFSTLQSLFPNRKIEQLAIDGIASGGGSIHCTTQQQPKVQN